MARALRHDRLHHQIAVDLAQEILVGEVKDASLPAIPALAGRYGVSGQVVREALLALSASGLVQIQHGKRATVASHGEWNVLHPLVAEAMGGVGMVEELAASAYEIRRALEPLAAREAAAHRTEGDVVAIYQIIDEMASFVGDSDAFLAADSAFHVAVAVAAKNLILQSVIRDLRLLMLAIWKRAMLSSEDQITALNYHRGIAREIESRDEDAAAKLMLGHLIWAEGMEQQKGHERT